MGIPVSSGIGTGAAQVFSTDKSYSAMGDVLNRGIKLMDDKKLQEQQRLRDERDAKERDNAKINALRKGAEVNYGNMKPADVDVTLKEATDFAKKWEGNWQRILENDPATVTEYYKDLNALQSNVSKRVETWKDLQGIMKRVTTNPEKYRPSQINLLNEAYLTPNLDMSNYSSAFGEKIDVGNLVSDLSKNYEGILLKKSYLTSDDNGKRGWVGDVLEDEKKSYPEFKQALSLDLNTKARIFAAVEDNPAYEKDERGMLTPKGQEDAIRNAFESGRNNIRESVQSFDVSNKEDEQGGNQYYDSKNWNIQKVKDEKGQEWTTIDKRTGGKIPLKNMSLTGVDGYPKDLLSGDIIAYRHDKDNKVIAKVSGTTFNEKNQKASLQEVEVYLPSTVWGTITNTISSNVGLKDLSNALSPTNVAKQKGGTDEFGFTK